mmetsp:Transcript_239/g.826  ORF Transcript_239/g.826 Transcript_239/m.826 type:complete len:88 (+) Transcript_239:239-502(+)
MVHQHQVQRRATAMHRHLVNGMAARLTTPVFCKPYKRGSGLVEEVLCLLARNLLPPLEGKRRLHLAMPLHLAKPLPQLRCTASCCKS